VSEKEGGLVHRVPAHVSALPSFLSHSLSYTLFSHRLTPIPTTIPDNNKNIKDIGIIIVAIFLPPLAVFIKRNACDLDVLINILLTILGWIPGIIHALYVVFKTPSPPTHMSV